MIYLFSGSGLVYRISLHTGKLVCSWVIFKIQKERWGNIESDFFFLYDSHLRDGNTPALLTWHFTVRFCQFFLIIPIWRKTTLNTWVTNKITQEVNDITEQFSSIELSCLSSYWNHSEESLFRTACDTLWGWEILWQNQKCTVITVHCCTENRENLSCSGFESNSPNNE